MQWLYDFETPLELEGDEQGETGSIRAFLGRGPNEFEETTGAPLAVTV